MTDDIRQVNMRLSAETVQEIEDIKAYHNILSTVDAIRFLIRQEWRRIKYQPALPGMIQEAAK